MYTHHLTPPFRVRLVSTRSEIRKLQVEESISQCSKILKVDGVLLGQGVPERFNKELIVEVKIGRGYRVWQRSPCLLLLLRMCRQSHMRVIFVHHNVHFDKSMSLFPIFAGHCPELIIAKGVVVHHVACHQFRRSMSCS
ncbi:hypothetical protein Y032_0286g1407 [Ancylostoma ceylanicum]|uniref:Uncharacterized protein n=1 Tax=Ancylostoma ceylanicum TaxID=53326 RepID=A0A016S772_9BILA|nr:hypothetical protein Y032_0286g1407 [Ancylostoma ceylanicum]